MTRARIGIGALLVLLVLMVSGSSLGSRTDYDPARGVITLPEPASPFIAFNIWVKVGSQNDPDGKEGLAAMTAALLAGGSTTEDSYEGIRRKLYPMAAGYGYRVDKEMTVFTGRIHRDNLDAYYTLFSNALLKPAFNQEDFERIKSQTLNFVERGRRYGRDEELTKELLFSMIYRGTPYEHPVEGYVESVRSITLDDVKAFYESVYLGNNLVVGIGGGYPRGFPDRVRRDFDGLPRGEVPAVPAPEPRMPEGVKVLIVEKATDATPISMGFPMGLLRGDEDFWSMMAFNSWMGEHRNSFGTLYQVIRETRGMNYGDYSYIEAFPLGFTTQQPPVNVGRRSQVFEIWIRPISNTTPTNLHERVLFATRAALREVAKVVDNGLPPDQVERTRNFLWNFTVNWGNTISRRLAYAVDDAFYGLPEPGYLAGIRPGLQGLTTEGVNEAVREHLQTDNLWIVFITRDAPNLKRLLVEGVPTGITYPGPRPDAVLAEDREIAVFPIPVGADDIIIMDINDVYQRR
jgi:zinc protease